MRLILLLSLVFLHLFFYIGCSSGREKHVSSEFKKFTETSEHSIRSASSSIFTFDNWYYTSQERTSLLVGFGSSGNLMSSFGRNYSEGGWQTQFGGAGRQKLELRGYESSEITGIAEIPETGKIFAVGVCRKKIPVPGKGEQFKFVYHSFIASFYKNGERDTEFGDMYPFQNIDEIGKLSVGSNGLSRNQKGIVVIEHPMSIIRSIKLYDNKLIIAGTSLDSGNDQYYGSDVSFTQSTIPLAGNKKQIMLMRFNLDGSVDSTFGTRGMVFSYFEFGAEAFAFDVQKSDGKIVVGGTLGLKPYIRDEKNIENELILKLESYTFLIARFNSNGSLDNNFGNWKWNNLKGFTRTDFAGHGVVHRSKINDIKVSGDGKIVVVGSSILLAEDAPSGPDLYSTLRKFMILGRYDRKGYPDISLGGKGFIKDNIMPSNYKEQSFLIDESPIGTTGTAIILRNKKIVVSAVVSFPVRMDSLRKVDLGGDWRDLLTPTFSSIVRYEWDGSRDETWGERVSSGSTNLGGKTGVQSFFYEDRPLASPIFHTIGIKLDQVIPVGTIYSFGVIRRESSEISKVSDYPIELMEFLEAPLLLVYGDWNSSYFLRGYYDTTSPSKTVNGGQGRFSSISVNEKMGSFLIGGSERNPSYGQPSFDLESPTICLNRSRDVVPCPSRFDRSIFSEN